MSAGATSISEALELSPIMATKLSHRLLGENLACHRPAFGLEVSTRSGLSASGFPVGQSANDTVSPGYGP